DDPSVGVRAPGQPQMERAREEDVVEIAAPPGHEARVLLPFERGADQHATPYPFGIPTLPRELGPEMRVAALLEGRIGVGHQIRTGVGEHQLEIGRVETDVHEAVENAGRAGYAVPRAQHGLRAAARSVLDKDLDLAAEDEEHLLDLVGVRGIALARRD